ncbi:MAG: ribbon-helix-helix protein, CopG family [Acidimicrobiia bacterium]
MPRKRPVLGPVGQDIDLDKEEVVLPDGTRLTEEGAEALAQRVLARRRGRPSVTGVGARTPSLTVRVPPATRAALEALAGRQGRRLADVSRDALEEYVRRHARAAKAEIRAQQHG